MGDTTGVTAKQATKEWAIQEAFKDLNEDLEREQTFGLRQADGTTAQLKGTGLDILKEAFTLRAREAALSSDPFSSGYRPLPRFSDLYETRGFGGTKPSVAHIIEDMNGDYTDTQTMTADIALPVKPRSLMERIKNVLQQHGDDKRLGKIEVADLENSPAYQDFCARVREVGLAVEPYVIGDQLMSKEPWFVGNDFLPGHTYDPATVAFKFSLASKGEEAIGGVPAPNKTLPAPGAPAPG